MSKMIEKRKLEYLPKKQYDKLPKKTIDVLLEYRRTYSRVVRKEGKIDNLKSTIEKEQDNVRKLKKELTKLNGIIDPLRSDFEFGCGLTQKKRPSGKVYYILQINRSGCDTKSISLGREETIVNQLKQYYKGRRTKLKDLNDDWKWFIKSECMLGEIYDKIFDMIVKDPKGFQQLPINRDTLIPIK